jgi:hypothetical protein
MLLLLLLPLLSWCALMLAVVSDAGIKLLVKRSSQ